jgi:lipopolysaccharide/colanic/teichoic acid biosynthesis glycosyltransferase
VNVLRGEMSLVGPRPLVPEEDRLVSDDFHMRLLVRPGMTGPWQVRRYARPALREMIEIDCAYARGWSIRGDIKILYQTLLYVLLMRGV